VATCFKCGSVRVFGWDVFFTKVGRAGSPNPDGTVDSEGVVVVVAGVEGVVATAGVGTGVGAGEDSALLAVVEGPFSEEGDASDGGLLKAPLV